MYKKCINRLFRNTNHLFVTGVDLNPLSFVIHLKYLIMLIWNPVNFKILIIGAPEDVVELVEKRIKTVISVPLDICLLTLNEADDPAIEIPVADLIVFDKKDCDRVSPLLESKSNISVECGPVLRYSRIQGKKGEEIEFCFKSTNFSS